MEINVGGKVVKLEVIPLHELKPYERNSKAHPVSQMTALANSINEFGNKSVILVDKNNVIIAGHARYEAAAYLGQTELLCMIADDLDEDHVNAYRIVDNKIAEQGWTDPINFNYEIENIKDIDFELFGIEIEKVDIEPVSEISERISERKPQEMKRVVCPECNHVFIPKKKIG
jgi:ParB-like chromosome segregation protein Spo0J